jgi:hypothetical protein
MVYGFAVFFDGSVKVIVGADVNAVDTILLPDFSGKHDVKNDEGNVRALDKSKGVRAGMRRQRFVTFPLKI